MLVNAQDLGQATIPGTKYAIIGGGPVGLTLARELQRDGHTVRIIESGGASYTRSLRRLPTVLRQHLRGAQQFSAGEQGADPYFHLRFARARALGGSSHVWRDHGLRSRALDAIDLEPRPECGLEGWPIAEAELRPYYERARLAACLPGSEEPTLGPEAVPDLPDGLEIAMFRHADPAVFHRAGADLADAAGVEVLLNATVLDFTAWGPPTDTVPITLRTLGGRTLRTDAEILVLAAGGIENARLLLLAGERGAPVSPVTGTRFMEHLHVPVGYVHAARPLPFEDRFEPQGAGFTPRGTLRLSEEIRRREHLLGAVFHLRRIPPVAATGAFESARHVRRLAHHGMVGRAMALQMASAFARLPAAALTGLRGGDTRTIYAIDAQAEQLPLARSRVVLGRRRDRLGQPRARLEWRLDPRDLASLEASVDRIGDLMADAGLGAAQRTLGKRRPGTPFYGGWHHMGTTRMGTAAGDAVVDTDARVFGLERVYVAGSSLFPTGGAANPTLTAIALAIRLADHLRGA